MVSSDFIIPDEYQKYSEIIKDGIRHYSSFEERRSFEKKLADTGEIPEFYKYDREISTQMESQIK